MKIDEIMQLISSLQSKKIENTFSKKGVTIKYQIGLFSGQYFTNPHLIFNLKALSTPHCQSVILGFINDCNEKLLNVDVSKRNQDSQFVNLSSNHGLDSVFSVRLLF